MAKPLYCGAANVMQAFDSLRPDNAYFSVWQGNKMLYQYNGEDNAAGRDILDQMMTAAENNYNTDVFDIKFHSKLDDGYITNKSKVIGTMPVRAYDPAADGADHEITGITRPGDVPKPVYHMLQRIDERFALEDRLKALETAAPEVKEPDWFDRISGLLEKPGMVETVGSLLAPILQRLVPGAALANIPVNGTERVMERSAPQPPVIPAINEPENEKNTPIDHNVENDAFTDEDNEVIDRALYDLSAYCNPVEVLPLLVDYAGKNRVMFDYLIGQLKDGKNG